VTISTTLAASPFKGLASFGDSDVDALFFFGREREIEVIATNLLASRLTVLYGPTGVGKSSILRAGVARTLRAVPFPRRVVVFDRWADDPVGPLSTYVAEQAGVSARESLAETLADAGAALDGELYLILDQLEEYFVYHRPRHEPGSFIDELAEVVTRASVRANVLLSLREDALAKLDVLKPRVPALFSNYLRLDHLDREAGRRAIVAPPERWNEVFGEDQPVSVEPELVDAVLEEVTAGKVLAEGTGRGGVGSGAAARIEAPYLQLVMERLWQVEREHGSTTLQLSTLMELGGAERIVGDHLQGALRDLLPEQQEIAAALFLHLVTPSGTKIAYTIGDLARYAGASEDETRDVIDRLAGERILRPVVGTTGVEARYEIFHDVLAGAALDWQTRFDAQRSEAEARRVAEARHRRATIVAAVSLAALVVVTAIAVFAVVQRREARSHARVAHANELAFGALLLQAEDPGSALAQALDAARLNPSTDTEDVLRTSLIASRLRRVLKTKSPTTVVAYDPRGGRVALGSEDGRVRIWRPVANRVEHTLDVGGPVTGLEYSPDGATVLVTGGGATLWNPTTGKSKHVRGAQPVVAAVLSADGRLLVTSAGGRITVQRVKSGAVARRIRTVGSAVKLAISPDSRTLAVVAAQQNGHVTPATYDLRTGRLLAQLPQRGVTAAAFAPRAPVFATSSADGTVDLWDARTGRRLHILDDGGGSIADVAFSPDGTMLATASSDGGVRVWRVADASRFFYFEGHHGPAVRVAFSPNGALLVSTSQDRTARVWSVGGIEAGTLAAVLAGNGGAVTTAAFAPSGKSVVTGADDGTARLWDTQIDQQLVPIVRGPGPVSAARVVGDGHTLVDVTGRSVEVRRGQSVRRHPLRASLFAIGPTGAVAVVRGDSVAVRGVRFRAPTSVTAVSFSLDGTALAAATRNGDLLVWDTTTGELVHHMRVEPGVVRIGLSPDRDTVATGDSSGAVELWAFDGELLHNLREHAQPVTDVRFDPSGRLLVTASEGSSRNVALWDVRTGRLLHPLIGHFGTVTAASFSPDGRWILTAGPISSAIWSLSSTSPLFYLRGPTDLLTDAEWAPTGFAVTTAERDGIIRTYNCTLCRPLSGLEALAEARLTAR
jgi:WD40 repeat protein